jgi:hypothetical protein
MMDNNKFSDNEKPEEIIEQIENILDSLHKDLTQDAIEVGQAKDRFKAIKPLWENLGNASTEDPDAAQIYHSGTLALSSIRDDYKSIAQDYLHHHDAMETILPSSDSTVSLTNSTATILITKTNNRIVNGIDGIFEPINISRREKTRHRLNKLSTEIAETYDSIWEVLYGTRSNPERGSLYLIRQVFDHLFGVLAPDNEVKLSKFWHPKDENEPHQVTRSERIVYAAHTHAKNRTAAKRLIASTTHMLDVYKALNKAHKRGRLDRLQSRSSLKEMQAIIEDWVQSIFVSK